MAVKNIVAVDLGASSGRVMLATLHTATQHLTLKEIHRFSNTLVFQDNHHQWDLAALESDILTGLHQIDAMGITPDSIGIDSWGVDYVLLDKNGQRVGLPYSYRDHRTDGIMAAVTAELGREAIYQRTGIQFLPFNTLYQLKALCDAPSDDLDQVAHLLMIPDYFHYRLTGNVVCEYTNASTTQLLNLEKKTWDSELLDYLSIPRRWLSDPVQPGHAVGNWTAPSGRHIPVTTVATHDTASAVVGAPLLSRDSAYLSSGTWSLMGIESDTPFNSPQALAANITNEGGIDGTYRVLKNIMGLWLLQRVCQERDIKDLGALIQSAAALPAFTSLINPNDDRFINPPSMHQAIRDYCREHGQPVPQSDAELARCIFDSLALLYRQVVLELGELRHAPIRQLHIVGGGSQNAFLNQLCADVCQIPVLAGPVEASTLGNIGCQLMALGAVADLAAFRHMLTHNFPLHRYTPRAESDFAGHWRRFQALSQPETAPQGKKETMQ
ncbi:rhamnulokinase [Pectobacterium actinidiae]|uniref:Rhamnulokinase n=1 Tax=Pectobacterium actinidiae TaxID=1507808 RepID=A0A1V2R959_9GAMM|nr:rhamnulokinase [Pectobacterium actinidiae]KHN90202.1 rhamnulokinase [Pectobacterium actinidiae]ONK07096.1 rhamnulokinase [Pectobacterium actinidiae]ONK08989.1 rhamnulokinase [Pectobacterium actinidiae]